VYASIVTTSSQVPPTPRIPRKSPEDERPVSRRRAATRDRLVGAAQEVFAERGFHGASVEDICDRAQFTRGAFYSNFSSKDELVLEISARYADRLLAGIAEIAEQDDLDPTQIVTAVLGVWTRDRREREMWFLLQTEFTLHAIRDREVGRAWARHQASVRRGLAGLVDEVCRRRHLTLGVTSQDFARVAMALFSAGTSQHLLEPRSRAVGATFLPLILEAATSTEPGP
jgi:AcrR family transcriptional regulator